MFNRLDYRGASKKRRFRYLEILISGCVDGEFSIGTLRKAMGRRDFPVLDELVPPYLMNVSGEAHDRLVYLLREVGFDRAKIRELRGSDEWGRAFAAYLLGLMRHKPAIPALVKSARSNSNLVSFASASALAGMGDSSALSDIHSHAENPLEPFLEMVACMDEELISVLEDERSEFRMKQVAMEALGAIGCYRAARPILRIGCDTDSYPIKTACIRVLGELHYLKGVPFLLECLEDESWAVRSEAVKSLGKMGGISLTAVIAGKLSDESRWVRYNSAHTLSDMGELGIRTLSDALYSGEEKIREAAWLALSRKGYFHPT